VPSTGSPRTRRHRLTILLTVALTVSAAVWSAVVGGAPALAAAASSLARYPYLTDVTTSSVQVTWADTYMNTYGAVSLGVGGSSCATSTVRASKLGTRFTVVNTAEYQHSVTITGLAAGTRYCYRVKGSSTNALDLLGTDSSPTFTTLPTSGSYSFLAFGDWGDTSAGANVNQAKLDALMAKAGASFAVGTGDIAYATGTQSQYGDLLNTGTSVSEVFGTDYWRAPGAVLPFYSTPGNHGRTSTFFQIWPEPSSAGASGESYSVVNYPASSFGSTATAGPAAWYAFDVAGARYYVLTADWSDTNTGSATGSLCSLQFSTRTCPDYQTDADLHWTPGRAEYEWLKSDLAAHPGSLKMAFFHYPLRSDDATEPGDVYLQNSPANPNAATSLERLLHDDGVRLVFNGHAHIYQRNIAPPGGVPSYVTGGGGATLTPIAKSSTAYCSSTDAYGLGWSATTGSYCGNAGAKPTSPSAVFHFLKVTVNGSTVTVAPTNADGQVFDAKTYNFGADTTRPTAPAGVQAKYVSATKPYVAVTWTPGTDSGSGVAAHDIYRQAPGAATRTYLATVGPDKTAYNDTTAAAGTAYVYSVDTRDQAGNAATATAAPVGSATADTTAPSVPANLRATAAGASEIDLSWTGSTDNVAVTGYRVYRDGSATALATVAGTTYRDTGVAAGTTHSYTVSAVDAAGNASAKSGAASATTASSGGRTVTVAPSDDATIAKVAGSTTTNYGSTATLTVDADQNQNDFLMKFPIPTGCTPSAATLSLTVAGGSTSGSARGGSVYAAPGAWAEKTVTAATAPPATGTPVTIGAVAAKTSYLLDVSALLAQATTNATISLRAATTSNDAATYVSNNASNAATAGPKLLLTC
jgi:hypothetical protein